MATRNGIPFLLTKAQIEQLLQEAGITRADWSIRGYHLARFNDSGNYEMGNCHFIPARQNIQERKFSGKSAAQGTINMLAAHAKWTHEDYVRIARLGGLATARKHPTRVVKKCEPNCVCGKHSNGGNNKGIPHTQETKDKIRAGVLKHLRS